MNYEMTGTSNHKTATVLATIATLAGVLLGASAVGSEHMVFGHRGLFKDTYIKGERGKRGIEQQSNINQNAICETAGGYSAIDRSCNNTANVGTTNNGGIAGTGYYGRQGIEQQSNIDQNAICETAGGYSPISSSCNNTANVGTTNNGGIAGTGYYGRQGIEQQSDNDQGATCETAGGYSEIMGSCINVGGGTTSNTGGITGMIRIPFGGFP